MSTLKLTAMNRRAFLMASATASLSPLAIAALKPTTAFANAPIAGATSAAWYRFKIGDFEATVISDGSLNLGPASGLYPQTPREDVDGLLKSEFRATDPYVAEENCLVINTGAKLVLIDSGIGSSKIFGQGAGRLAANLRAAGIRPEDIDAVLLTHGHIDHLSGLVGDDGKPAFPNAQLMMSKTEYDFWTDEAKTSATGVFKLLVDAARKNLLPHRDRLTFLESGKDAYTGIQALATPGHTPGHTSYLIASGGERYLYTGDVVSNSVISLEKPAWAFSFDGDPKLAAATRVRTLDMAVADKLTLIAYHFAFPGIGNVARNAAAYRFFPAAMEF
jgi:glyoxylase-like metal-dependent hydrolase (beta-lactamase superfamily II)